SSPPPRIPFRAISSAFSAMLPKSEFWVTLWPPDRVRNRVGATVTKRSSWSGDVARQNLAVVLPQRGVSDAGLLLDPGRRDPDIAKRRRHVGVLRGVEPALPDAAGPQPVVPVRRERLRLNRRAPRRHEHRLLGPHVERLERGQARRYSRTVARRTVENSSGRS